MEGLKEGGYEGEMKRWGRERDRDDTETQKETENKLLKRMSATWKRNFCYGSILL